ncbi:alpha/beta fold hydrolase [Candidatus Foliamicus sp.]
MSGLIRIGEAELYAEEQGAGEAMLLVSGLGGSGTFWRNQAKHFATRYRVVSYDHRGVGRSPAAPLHSSVAEMAEDALALMDALDIEAAHLVGHSTGGAIGQYLAFHAPSRLRSLVLSASWAGPTPLFTDLFRVRRKILLESGPESYLFSGSLLVTPAWALEGSYPGMEEVVRQRLTVFPGTEVELGRLKAVMNHDLRDQVKNIRTPTGIISAHDDNVTPPELSRELAQRIPGAIQVLLPQGGHFCPVTVTQDYNRELEGLLGKLEARC